MKSLGLKSKVRRAATAAQNAVCQVAPLPVLQCPTPRSVTSVSMKRKNIHLGADDKYGHWWMELAGQESYGWWPKPPLTTRNVDGGLKANAVGTANSLKNTMLGVDGELNGQTTFGGTATMDPHHGDTAEEEFHPVIAPGDTRTDEEIKQCLRKFAQSYSGEWRWTFGSGQNCHTFQEAAMKHCKLKQP